MSIVIGGSPGTGSSLLCALLNSHPAVFCGPETYLFAKPQLYLNWPRLKQRLLIRGIFGLRSPGWHLYNGLNLLESSFGWKKKELHEIISRSESFNKFYKDFFLRATIKHRKTLWAEKTPANVYSFNQIHKTDKDILTVHTVRHPLDTIASLVFRGFTPFQAISNCLCNTHAGLSVLSDERHYVLKYEKLVTDPVRVMNKLLKLFDLSWNPDIVKMDWPSDGMPGWKNNPGGAISTESIGRFEELEPDLQEAILYYCTRIEINPPIVQNNISRHTNILEISKYLGYDLPAKLPGEKRPLKMYEIRKDMWNRTIRGYPTHFLNYPIKIKKNP